MRKGLLLEDVVTPLASSGPQGGVRLSVTQIKPLSFTNESRHMERDVLSLPFYKGKFESFRLFTCVESPPRQTGRSCGRLYKQGLQRNPAVIFPRVISASRNDKEFAGIGRDRRLDPQVSEEG